METVRYENFYISLSELLKTEDFPLVANISERSRVNGKSILKSREILFQNRMKVKFAQVKILDFDNKEEIEEEKGIDFVMEHDNFVGDTYLLPIKYNGLLKFVHRPGSRKNYFLISQVLQDLPRFVRVVEDTVALPSNGIGRNIIVPSSTVLEVIRKFTTEGVTFLECSDGHASYTFSEKDRVSFSEVQDEMLYNLLELVRMKLLPKVFQFTDVDPTDIIPMDDEINSGLSTMVCGPMELTRFVDVDIVVGWVRDQKSKTYKTSIIPSTIWPFIQIQKRTFSEPNKKRMYIEKKYSHCVQSDFVEKSLYLISLEKSEITWLRSPDFYQRNYSGSSLFEVVYIDFQESSDDDKNADMAYTGLGDCPPPVPDRPARMLDAQVVTRQPPKVKERMSIIWKVHQELKNWFTTKSKQPENKEKKRKACDSNTRSYMDTRNAPQTFTGSSRCSSDSGIKESRTASDYTMQQHDALTGLDEDDYHAILEETGQYSDTTESSDRQAKSEEDVTTLPIQKNSTITNFPSLSTSATNLNSDENDSNSTVGNGFHTVDMLEHPRNDGVQCMAADSSYLVPVYQHDSTATNKDARKQTEQEEHSARLDLPSLLSEENETNSIRLPNSNEFAVNEILVSNSHSNFLHEPETICTENVFFCYSVNETFKCLRYCGLKVFADECFKNTLDGSFFRNLDLEELKRDPFNLSDFQILKVRKIIFEGWRPNIGE